MSKRPPLPDYVVQAVAEAMAAAGTADLETLARVAVTTAAPHLAAATLNDFRRTTRDDYQDTYRDWWAGIVENPDGTLNRDHVARELADYAALMAAASEVYCAVTNGRISKPNTLPAAVIGLAEECAQELADEAVAAERERCADLVSREAAAILYDVAELLRQEPGPGEAGHPGPQASGEGKGAP